MQKGLMHQSQLDNSDEVTGPKVEFLMGSPDGVVTLPRGRRKTLQRVLRSSCSGRRLPSPHSFAAKLAKCLARNQVSLDVEGVVDGGVYCKKSLS